MIRLRSFHLARQSGFTLLEVLLAFVIFALSFAVTLEILSGAIRNTSRAKENTEAALVAQSLMDQVGLDIPLRNGASFQGNEGSFDWEISIFPYQGTEQTSRTLELVDLTGVDLLEVECVLSWGEGSRRRSQTFSTVKAVLHDAEGLKI